MSVGDVASKFGRSRTWVNRILVGVDRRPGRRIPGVRAAWHSDAVAMFQTGATLRAIGDRLGVTSERVRQVIKPLLPAEVRGSVRAKRAHDAEQARLTGACAGCGRPIRASRKVCGARECMAAHMSRPMPEDYQRAADLVMTGVPYTVAAMAVGLPRSSAISLSSRMRRKGLVPPPVVLLCRTGCGRRFTAERSAPATRRRICPACEAERPAKAASAVRLYRSGLSLLATAQRIGLCSQFVQDALRAAGVQTRPRTRRPA
jgi:transposase-like protein